MKSLSTMFHLGRPDRRYLPLLTLLLIMTSMTLFAQQGQVSGTVTEDGFPLIGATVVVKGTSTGTVTDLDGKYALQVPGDAVLVFTYTGYTNQEVPVNGQSIIDVVMEVNATTLGEVVVTGYGTQSRAKMTTSVSKLDSRVLETSMRSNAATALQGNVAGLRVTNTTGQPGSTPQIILRGGTDFNGGGSPLILIDGVPGSFYALNSDDIESIEVLKDAAATAIYGARSANGVVLVTTKSTLF